MAYALSVAETIDSSDPTTYSEVVKALDLSKLLVAMQEEIESLHKNETWELVISPMARGLLVANVYLRRRMVQTMKTPDIREGVAKGYSKVEGVDFHDVFSLMIKHTSIRALLAPFTMHNLDLEQLYVKTALYMVIEMRTHTSKDLSEINHLKALLNSEFEMKDLGAAKKILRMEISRDKYKRKLFLSQYRYIEKVLERDVKPVNTPLFAHFKLLASLSHRQRRMRGDLDRRRSLMGYLFAIGDCAINLEGYFTGCSGLSTTEIDLMAITKAV
ncbi:hypothetical protein CRG98_041833 [Punica granatum]|uniref:Reverse transcriptase Ty1/copia-type domain-containing protein n=1 Tax=Punica granatum TaxID=22663 RepID=A0A2I0I1F5_PUNGR|nr:hypothetical protein CRG98_041833 [Punica granatum]